MAASSIFNTGMFYDVYISLKKLFIHIKTKSFSKYKKSWTKELRIMKSEQKNCRYIKHKKEQIFVIFFLLFFYALPWYQSNKVFNKLPQIFTPKYLPPDIYPYFTTFCTSAVISSPPNTATACTLAAKSFAIASFFLFANSTLYFFNNFSLLFCLLFTYFHVVFL